MTFTFVLLSILPGARGPVLKALLDWGVKHGR
jgi:hypothetical protein